MSKKIISLALALIMCLALVPMTALAAGVTLSLDQTDYKAGALITITYSGVTNEQIAAQAVVAFAKQGAPASKYDKWTYVKENSGTVTLWASGEAGNYEMRFYQGRSINETNLVSSATATFTIGGGSETTTPPTTQPPATTTPPVTQPPVIRPPAIGLTATPTASTVLVNGKSVAFDAYNIGGNNYFKLRDLAYTLNGTAKQFNVGWDGANNAIMLTSGQGYTADGGEMSGKGGGAKTAVPTTSKIIKDGKEASFTAYNIDGSNYFKLRDIGAAFNFGVDWDGTKNTIVIDTGKGYGAEGQTTTPPATTEPPKPPSGSIDKNLIGEWNYEDITSSEHHNYFFYDNSTASLFITGNTNYHGEAKFSTANGKIYLTEYYYINAIGEKTLRIDKVVEYSIGKDERGEYLTIGNIPGYTEYGENRPNMKFRKGAGTTEPTKPTAPPSGTTSLAGTWMYSSAGSDDTFYQDSCKSGTFAYTQGVKYPRNARLFVFRADGTGTRVLITESAISSAQFTYTASSSEITMSLTSNTNHHSDSSVNTEQYSPPNTRTERYKISVGEDGKTYMEMTLLDNWLNNHFYKIQ